MAYLESFTPVEFFKSLEGTQFLLDLVAFIESTGHTLTDVYEFVYSPGEWIDITFTDNTTHKYEVK